MLYNWFPSVQVLNRPFIQRTYIVAARYGFPSTSRLLSEYPVSSYPCGVSSPLVSSIYTVLPQTYGRVRVLEDAMVVKDGHRGSHCAQAGCSSGSGDHLYRYVTIVYVFLCSDIFSCPIASLRAHHTIQNQTFYTHARWKLGLRLSNRVYWGEGMYSLLYDTPFKLTS